jgi:hypothetical protein
MRVISLAVDSWFRVQGHDTGSCFKTTPEAGKPRIRLKSKPATITAGKAQYWVNRFVPLAAGFSPFKKEYDRISWFSIPL